MLGGLSLLRSQRRRAHLSGGPASSLVQRRRWPGRTPETGYKKFCTKAEILNFRIICLEIIWVCLGRFSPILDLLDPQN